MNENMIEAAMRYLNLGYRPIPLLAGLKGARIKWKKYQTESPTENEVIEWSGKEGPAMPNIGLVTGNGVVVVDVDDAALLEAVVAHCGDSPMKCRTPRGGLHVWYRMRQGVHYDNSVKINGRAIDLRCEGSYAVSPWSRTENGFYRWEGDVVPATELPLVKISWLRERKPKRKLQLIEPSASVDVVIRRARAYLATIEGAVSGNRGHDRTMRVAGVLVQKFGLLPEEALPLFVEWSEKSCDPPWEISALIHKLNDAYRLRFERGLKKIE